MLEYFFCIIQRTKAGSFRSQQASAVGDPFAGENSVFICIADALVLTEHVSDLSAADTDVSGRNVCIDADMPV